MKTSWSLVEIEVKRALSTPAQSLLDAVRIEDLNVIGEADIDPPRAMCCRLAIVRHFGSKGKAMRVSNRPAAA